MDSHRSGNTSLYLLARARAGDDSALTELLERYIPRLRRWASGRVPRTARPMIETDDIVQETVIRTLRHLEDFDARGEGALQAYLRQAIRNRLTRDFAQTLISGQRRRPSTSRPMPMIRGLARLPDRAWRLGPGSPE